MTRAVQIVEPPALPALIAGEAGRRRAREFFAAQIRNPNTREAYLRAVGQFFAWCQANGATDLAQIEPISVAAYVEQHPGSDATKKQHLSALRRFFDYLVTGQVIPTNPAASVTSPRLVVRRGKTPILDAEETRQLFDSFPTDNLVGLRDRALCGVLIYSCARISAALGMNVEDFYTEQRRSWFRLHEKGGRLHQVPATLEAAEFVDAYLAAAGLHTGQSADTPLFRTVDRARQPTANRLTRNDALKMIRRRVKAAGIETKISPHSFRATGITLMRLNGRSLDEAQEVAAHASPKTTRLYDRSRDAVTLDAVNSIRF